MGGVLTKTSIQTKEQLTDAEGDGGVSWNDDSFVTTFRDSAIVDLKLTDKTTLDLVVNDVLNTFIHLSAQCLQMFKTFFPFWIFIGKIR